MFVLADKAVDPSAREPPFLPRNFPQNFDKICCFPLLCKI